MTLCRSLGFGLGFSSIVAGCAPTPSGTGERNGAGGETSSNSPPPAYTAPGVDLINDAAACKPSSPSVGRTPLRRISRVEYNNMVRDLLGDESRPADNFVSEEKVVGFNSNSYTEVSALIMRQYWDAAEKIATSRASDHQSLLACGSNVADDCVQTFIGKFAKRAFRGALDDAGAKALFTLYQDTKTQFDVQTGVQALLTEILTSPRFLFVFEFGQGSPNGRQQPLSSWELATRLSLFLWRSVPDDTLARAADQNQLSTPEQIEQQAIRMLADQKARDALDDFVDQWLDIENMDSVTKDTVFANVWSPQIARDLHTETLTTYANLVDSGGSFVDLMTSNTSYINSGLANFYGVSAPGGGFAASQAVPSRKGILTHGSFLAAHAHTVLPSPILRGKIVRANVLCRPIPPPSSVPDLNGLIPPAPNAPAVGKTTRELYETHVSNPKCVGCHEAMDLIGFGFGKFDATGRLYADAKENDISIDASGDFRNAAPDLDGKTFTDQSAMIEALAASSQVRGCFALEQFRFALGRVETDADACALQQIYSEFSGASFNLKKLIIAVVKSSAFRNRSSVNAQGECR
ncbi:MAG: DUF1592 domain-containing protein [Myxococcota bacterium]